MNDHSSQRVNIDPSIVPPLPHSSPSAAVLRQKLYSMKTKIAQSLQPQLAYRVKQLISRQYNRVLLKVQKARSELSIKGYLFKSTDSKIFLKDQKQLEQFFTVLIHQLQDLIPQFVNEISEKIAKQLSSASPGNLIAKAINLYSSLMGSYMYTPTIKEILTPTVRTLHHLQQQMRDNYSEARGSQSSLWVVLYLISAIIVHLFGKYITKFQKIAVAIILKKIFIIHIIYIATSLEGPQIPLENLDETIQKWLIELKLHMAIKTPSL